MTLPSIKTQKNKIGLIELDVAPTLADLIGLDLSIQDNVETVTQLLAKLGSDASSYVTGLVIDPIYSFEVAQKKDRAGILTRLNTLSHEVDPLAVPTLIPNYGLEEIRNNYNLAALELFYHPQEENALKKKQLVAEISDYCDYLDIDLLLKLTVYSPANQATSQEFFQQDQLQAIQEFRSLASVLALQYPLDPLAAATVTAELDIPWLMSNQEQTYDEYKEELRICLENGATGFLVATSLWREINQYRLEDKRPDLEKINHFIETTFRDRVIELMRISEEI